MKKIIFILLICFIMIPGIFASDGWRMPDRSWEMGIANIDFGFSNNLINLSDVFQKELVIDLDKLKSGLFINLDLGVTPFYFSFNSKGNWGFKLSAGIDAHGLISLNDKMLSFAEAENEESDFAVSAFADAQLSVFFHIAKFKVTLAPSVFYPVVYTSPSIIYSKKDSNNGTDLSLDYKLTVFSAVSMAPGSTGDVTGSPGFDLSASLEFPLSEAIGLKKLISFLDFSVGLDVYNFSLVPSLLQDYMEISGKIGGDKIDIFNGLPDDLFQMDDIVYGQKDMEVIRPFRVHLWADWRPFKILGITGTFGFSINNAYVESFTFEGGAKARIDLGNILIVKAGAGYYDRVWINSVDFTLNLRLIQIDLGVNLRSNTLDKTFINGSPGFSFGFRFGW